MIFATNSTELICNTTVIDLPTSPTYCCCTTLGKLTFAVDLAHRARQRSELLQHETVKFIPPDLWPPNSPDFNSVDCRIWRVMQDRVYPTPVPEVAYLRQRLIGTWNDLSQSIVDDAVDEWRKRLQACVNEKRGHFEGTL